MLKRLKARYVEVKMLHIGLNDGWRAIDVIYVLTGKVIG